MHYLGPPLFFLIDLFYCTARKITTRRHKKTPSLLAASISCLWFSASGNSRQLVYVYYYDVFDRVPFVDAPTGAPFPADLFPRAKTKMSRACDVSTTTKYRYIALSQETYIRDTRVGHGARRDRDRVSVIEVESV